jgi:hypothetical protein
MEESNFGLWILNFGWRRKRMLDFGFQIENLRAWRGTRRFAANSTFKIQHSKLLLSWRPIQHSKSNIQNHPSRGGQFNIQNHSTAGGWTRSRQ